MALTDQDATQVGDLDRKEEFTQKQSDKDLIRQIDAWLEESSSFYQDLRRVWEENLEYYRGNQTDLLRIRGTRSKAVENRIWMAVETMIPIATARLPEIETLSNDDNEVAQRNADELKKALEFGNERMGVQEKSEKFARNMVVKRYGVFKKVWDKNIDDYDTIVVDPKRIRIPAFGRDVHELKYVIEDLEMSFEQLVEQFGKTKADEVFKANPKPSDDKVRKVTYSIQEVWTNETVVWRAGNIILKKEANPFFDFKNKKKNHFDKPQKPYIIKSLFHTTESIIGETDYVQQVKRIQDNINTRKRQIEDLTSLVGNPFLIIDSDVMSEEEAAQITNEPGQIIHGPGAADPGRIRFESPGQVPQYMFADLETSRNELDNIWGIHSTTRGEREGRETLGGRKLLRQADLGRIDLVARQIERALGESADWDTQMIKMFYTAERTFSILGDDGVEMIRAFKGDNVENVRLIVRPGSTLPRDEVTIHGEAIQLWQLGAIGIRTLYKMIKLPNAPEAVADYANTQSGAILQEGQQQAGGAPQGLEGIPNPQQQ